MLSRTKFDRETIVKAGFDTTREEGFAGITTRSVAKRLLCSVAPIFVHSSKK